MSGFTTTGASVVTDYGEINRSLGIWRQFTQWLGGMGIIVLAIAVLPRLRVGGRQLMESELPGPEIAALGERIRSTARKLWFLYVGLTAIQVLLLSVALGRGYRRPHDAVRGARPRLRDDADRRLLDPARLGGGVLGGVAVDPRALHGDRRGELRAHVPRHSSGGGRGCSLVTRSSGSTSCCVVGASAALTAMLWGYGIAEGEAAVRTAVFQTVSIMTTTGMASADFALWPPLLLLALFALMFVGGSAGSTGGSIKVVRHLLLGKVLRREIDQTLSPEFVMPIRLNGTPVDERTIRAVAAFILLYVGFWAVGASVSRSTRRSRASASARSTRWPCRRRRSATSAPAFGIAGPYGSFAEFGDVSKLTMIGLMWVGRLEIVPVVVLLTRHYWRL